jgi:hypothetical protein
MLLLKWNRLVAVALVCTIGLVVTLFVPALLAQPPEDKENQTDKALEDARARLRAVEARLKEAQDQLRVAEDKAKAAKNAVWSPAVREQFESLKWHFDRVELERIIVKSTDRHGPHSDLLSLQLILAKDVKIFVDGQEGSMKELRSGTQVSLRLAENRPEVTRIDATSNKPAPEQVIKAVDVAKKTVSVTIGGKVTLERLPVGGAAIYFSSDPEGRKRTIADLKPGMQVTFMELLVWHDQLVVDLIEVRSR